MRTHFRAEQLADPALAQAEKNLRACVHCGICTATCPTYVLVGDERDSPRGRIVMMQQMLEQGGTPSRETVHHLDRCLSCLGCRTACPSGVDYTRLIDQSRAHIDQHYRRPIGDRLLRWIIANVLTRPRWTQFALLLARAAGPLVRLLPKRMRGMAQLGRAVRSVESASAFHIISRGRKVALLPGCVQQVVAPEIDAAAARLLARRGISVVPVEGCCGALAFHLGREGDAKRLAQKMIEALEHTDAQNGFEGALITATGCAAHLQDYPHLFAGDEGWRQRATAFAARVKPLPDFLGDSVAPSETRPLRVALQVPCSQQHGLRTPDDTDLLRKAGYEVVAIPEGHLCCGSAGSYSLLEPEIANQLRTRKLENIASVSPDVVATSNVGCLQHLSGSDAPQVLHIAELLDWAEGGPVPPGLQPHAGLMARSAAKA